MGQNADAENRAIADRWCESRGSKWKVLDTAGRGGTAPVFTVSGPEGELALKLLDVEFSTGERREESLKRINKQVEAIGDHSCEFLIKVLGGGEFEDRLFLLMNKAPGIELAKCLDRVPRNKIPVILDQVARACAYLRSKDLCHRDIKSANVFVTDDFSKATLLDVSVARDINDPIGLGTDHGDKLPVVATSRYTPPEYLFRLVDPGPELWHAVDIYQLGGIIHDLVMQQEMFEDEYKSSSDNRYRFAWVVATEYPLVQSDDVDASILLLARRALDKDWKRRSQLRIEDFYQDEPSRQKVARSAIGLGALHQEVVTTNTAATRKLVSDCATLVEDTIRIHLLEEGVTAKHRIIPGQKATEKSLLFEWPLSAEYTLNFSAIRLRYDLHIEEVMGDVSFCISAIMTGVGDPDKTVILHLPSTPTKENAKEEVCSNAIEAIGKLATQLMVQPEKVN